MEAYGAVLNLVIPVFFMLYFVEVFVAWRRGEQVIRGLDSISSFSSGITNVVKDVLGLSVGILSYSWLVNKVASRTLVAWSSVQMFFSYFLLIYFFAFIGQIGAPGIFLYGAFVFISIYAYTELMDGNRYAHFYEIIKSAVGLYLIGQSGGDWFGAWENVGAWYVYAVGVYCEKIDSPPLLHISP
jgi:hypothetical protein